jgi:hypothetical protein
MTRIMKKQYINPTTDVVLLNMRQTLLAGSPDGAHDVPGDGTQLGREVDLFDEE